MKEALAGAFRFHADVGMATFNKARTSIPCTCNKKPMSFITLNHDFRHDTLDTVASTRSRGVENIENASSLEDVDLNDDGTQIIDAKKLMEQDKTSETNEDLATTKQTWSRKTM